MSADSLRRPAIHHLLPEADYILFPYEDEAGRLLFDDPAFDIVAEELTAGADTLLRMIAGAEGRPWPKDGCVAFGTMPGHGAHLLRHTGEEQGWQVYDCNWLTAKFCPVFRLYYPTPPPVLCLKFFVWERRERREHEPSAPPSAHGRGMDHGNTDPPAIPAGRA